MVKAKYFDIFLKTEHDLTNSISIINLFLRHTDVWLTLFLTLSLIINLLLTIGMHGEFDQNYVKINNVRAEVYPLNEDQTMNLIKIFGYLVIFLFSFLFMKEFIYALSEIRATAKTSGKIVKTLSDKVKYYLYDYVLKIMINIRVIYHVFLTWVLFIAFVNDTIIFYPCLMTYVVYSSRTLRNVMRAATEPYREIFWTMFLYFGIAWGYGVIIFLFFNKDYDRIVNDACYYLWSCYLISFDQGYKTGAGPGANDNLQLPYTHSSGNNITLHYNRYIFDYTYFFILIVLIFSILTGIIIDKFSELRSRTDELENDNKTLCFICGQTDIELESKDKNGGFNRHILNEHNKWDYVYFLSYIESKNANNKVALPENERLINLKYTARDNSWLPYEWNYSIKHD